MDMRNCPKCKKVFAYTRSPLCSTCEREEEQLFEKVRDYIKENPICTLSEVASATKASSKKIMKYIKEGKIEISQGMHGEVQCEQCGKPIAKGKYCDKCVININQTVDDMFTPKAKTAKMHIRSKK